MACAQDRAASNDFVIDIPLEFRSFVKFRTTLGHKANHRFVTNNVDYETVLHPVHGAIVCLVANTEIRPGEEITADYLYELDMAEPWYTDLYYQTYGTYKDNIES